MISLEGKIFYEPEQMHDFGSTLAVFFASYYVFNLEYQESASITLEMIQRFFVRIQTWEQNALQNLVQAARQVVS
ncbi:unnamed protein product [Oreochromis niloticus]|nr:unnamed protein product [Mustela putorius furo]